MQQFRDKIPGGQHMIPEDPTQEEMIRAQGKITGFSGNAPSSSEKIWGYDVGNGGRGAMEMLGSPESTSRPIENILGSGSGKKHNLDGYLSMGKSQGKKMNVDGYFNMGKKSKGMNVGSYLSMGKKGKSPNVSSYLSMGKKTKGLKMNTNKYFNMGKKKSVNMNQYFSTGHQKKVNMMDNKIAGILGGQANGQAKTNNAVNKILGQPNTKNKISNMLGGKQNSNKINMMLGNQGTGNQINKMLGQSNVNNKINNMLGGQGTGNQINKMLGIQSDNQSKDKFLDRVGNLFRGRGFTENAPTYETISPEPSGYESGEVNYDATAHETMDFTDPVSNPDVEIVDSKEEILDYSQTGPKVIKTPFGQVEVERVAAPTGDKKSMFGTVKGWAEEAHAEKQAEREKRRVHQDILNRQLRQDVTRKFEPKRYVLSETGKKHQIEGDLVNIDGKFFPLTDMNEDGTYSFGKSKIKYQMRTTESRPASTLTKTEAETLGLQLKGGQFTPTRRPGAGTEVWEALAQGGRGVVGLSDKVVGNAPGTLAKLGNVMFGDVGKRSFSDVVNEATGKRKHSGMPMITEVKKDKKGNVITTTKPLLKGKAGTHGYGVYGGTGMEGVGGYYGGVSPDTEWKQKVQMSMPMTGAGVGSAAADWQQKVESSVPMGGRARSLDFYSRPGDTATGLGVAQMTPRLGGAQYGSMVMGLQGKELPQVPVQMPVEQVAAPQEIVPQQPVQVISQPVAQAPSVVTEPTYTEQALSKQVSYRRGPYKKRRFVVTTPNASVAIQAQTIQQPGQPIQPQQAVEFEAPMQQMEEVPAEPVTNIQRTKQILGF